MKSLFAPLLLGLIVLAYLSVILFDEITITWFNKDADARSRLAASAVSAPLFSLVRSADEKQIHDMLTRLTRDERLFAIAFCKTDPQPVVTTELFPESINCKTIDLLDRVNKNLSTVQGMLHLTKVEVLNGAPKFGFLLFVHDMSFAARRSETTTRYLYAMFLVVGLFVSMFTILIIKLQRRDWMSGIRKIIRSKGQIEALPSSTSADLLPVLKDLRDLIGDLESDRRGNDGTSVVWDPATLKNLLSTRLSGDEIVIVSNREPYVHNWIDGQVKVQHPASGLVTALEPVMKACRGTWIAHGSGSADRDVVDGHDHIWMPPGKKEYKIRRVWLTREEEEGYYYGFSNEGLWPLCHIAHNRPNFRSRDWAYYQKVNERFADAVHKEARTDSPVVLVQDYHYAILPSLIRERLPLATIITFWHIPWPNPEAFGICPWRREILKGLLGSTILGFHTRFHQNNFLDTVDRYLECRIDREHFSVTHDQQTTEVRNYPISIEWNEGATTEVRAAAKDEIYRMHKLKAGCKIAVGIERLDYTKGILERFAGVERLLELYPHWAGKFTLIQVAAPSRTAIEAYSRLSSDVAAAAERINARFSSSAIPPIIYINRHLEQEEVARYFMSADVCLVTSLHDGMNLVAKEFVASRNDERGVLVLSMFAGASRELPEALVVNPYNADQVAQALNIALEMTEEEQRMRMRSMRAQVKEFNVYRWAGRMLIDAARAREKQNLISRLSVIPKTVVNT